MSGEDEFFPVPKEESVMFEPLKARAYHINQAAIDVCNRFEEFPTDLIIRLTSDNKRLLEAGVAKDRMIESLKSIVPTDGRPVYTLQEFGDIMRKVCQTEGVMLHEKQKGFFREIFASLTKCISDKGLMRQ